MPPLGSWQYVMAKPPSSPKLPCATDTVHRWCATVCTGIPGVSPGQRSEAVKRVASQRAMAGHNRASPIACDNCLFGATASCRRRIRPGPRDVHSLNSRSSPRRSPWCTWSTGRRDDPARASSEEEMAPRLSEAIDVLQGALDAEQNAHRLRAALTLRHLWSCLEVASSAPHRRNRGRGARD